MDVARDAQLLALGAREHTGIGRLLAGSVSHYCLSHSAVPVAAVPAPDDPGRRESDEIVVGLDDSPSGIAALSWAATWARRSGGRLRAVHVLGWPMGYVPKDYPDSRRAVPQIHQDGDLEYRASISQLFDKIDPEPDWNFEFAEGHPGKVLVQRSRRCRAPGDGYPGDGRTRPDADGVGQPSLPEPRTLPGRCCSSGLPFRTGVAIGAWCGTLHAE